MTKKKPKQKKSLASLFGDSPRATPEQRAKAWQDQMDTFRRMKVEWDTFNASPEGIARASLMARLLELKQDPAISQSETCQELLDAFHGCLDYRFMAKDSGDVISFLAFHFDGVRSKEANDKLKEKREKDRNRQHTFLDAQHDIVDTVRLAARLRKAFDIKAVRGSEDTVRAWKKLRSPGKTE